MKRILLTTTSLVLAAGVAQADITFSGATGIALIDDNGASVAGTSTNISLAAHQAAVEAQTAAETGETTAAQTLVNSRDTPAWPSEAAAGAAPTAAQTTLATANAIQLTATATAAEAALQTNDLAAGRASAAANCSNRSAKGSWSSSSKRSITRNT